ncbi:FAD-dependent oxidoreductase [Streptomyces sp. 2A115]|uniref:FAD-dependent oxidoreductase n=1 Tax=Streptomyces sp. 2A115 TaxID=3457439 RepID=UPI003FD34B88
MSRPRVVIVGAGFAGYQTARTLSRVARNKADIILLNPTDYFLYLPLLPQVAAGVLEPRRVTVSLSGTLPRVRLVLGEADGIDLDAQTVHYSDPEGGAGTLSYDRLVLAAGSVNKLLPIPGVAEHAHGFRGLPEALYLRDHVTRQVELAAAADDPETCSSRCTFVVVGAGYTGTEVAAHGQLFTDALVRKQPLRQGMRPRWLLLDIAPRVLPELHERLSRTADRVLRQRGVDVRTETSVKEATPDGVLLSDGEFIDTRTLVWCVGVRPDPLAEALGLAMERGRLLVEPNLQVPGRPEVFACGDAAAVPDLERPGQYTPMTAQHAWRQGKTAGHNVAASLGVGDRRDYRHRDMGFVVDLGGVKAAANPLGVHLSGPLAGAVTRGYHLAAMPGNRIRVAADWFLDAVLPRQAVQLGLVRSWSVPLDTASPELARVPGVPERATSPGARANLPDPRPGTPAAGGSVTRDPGNRPAPTSADLASPDPRRPTAPDPGPPAVAEPGPPAAHDPGRPALAGSDGHAAPAPGRKGGNPGSDDPASSDPERPAEGES